MLYVGITERGDAGLDFTWVDKMGGVAAAILITKSLNDRFIENVLLFKEKVVVHATITGMGGTIMEARVPTPEWSQAQVLKLIDAGFTVRQIVLRVDPIIPTSKGLQTAQRVLEMFKDVGIKRVRISFCDMYPHVRERFKKYGVPIPYEFDPTPEIVRNAVAMFEKYNNIYEFEACGEYVPFRVGCISQKDLDIFNIRVEI